MRSSCIRIPWHFIFAIIYNFFSETNCYNEEELDFERIETLSEVKMRKLDIEVIYYIEPEDRQKLCFYAAVKAQLPYVDNNHVSEWSRYWPPYNDFDTPYNFVLPCKGIPDFYLLRRGQGGERMQITFLHSSAKFYYLRAGISTVTSVKRRDDLRKKFKETEAVKMDIEGRKDLCARASKYFHSTKVTLYFLDENVDEAQPYEFQYEDRAETDIAIGCPTSPALYLRLEDLKDKILVHLILHQSKVDSYEFEEDKYEPFEVNLAYEDEESIIKFDNLRGLSPEDQPKLCTLARKHHILSTFVEDKEVTEAKFYSFQYVGQQKKENNWAILCPTTPTLYLQFVDRNKIKFTPITPKSIYHISGVGLVESVYKKMRKEMKEEDYANLQNHSFNKQLDAKARRDICYIAQKYIMDAGSEWKFRFTKKETVLEPFKLLLTPNCVGDPDVYDIQSTKGVYEYEADIVYMCTRWPAMYVRRTGSDDKLEILLLSKEVISSQ